MCKSAALVARQLELQFRPSIMPVESSLAAACVDAVECYNASREQLSCSLCGCSRMCKSAALVARQLELQFRPSIMPVESSLAAACVDAVECYNASREQLSCSLCGCSRVCKSTASVARQLELQFRPSIMPVESSLAAACVDTVVCVSLQHRLLVNWNCNFAPISGRVDQTIIVYSGSL
ncbi:hypothetical protein J6590_011307 [Homalodisca vitripennis]|nr:hypothetical protein J6590_011307 [Homalodisca vitripennis]